MTSYFEHNKLTKMESILTSLETGDVALVSEAGMPGISDPGYELIKTAIARNIDVIAIPGPSTVTTSLAVAGLPTDRFLFIGFLPNRAGARRRALEAVANERGTIITLEAPHRIKQALNDILITLGDRRIAVCRELTKLHEEVYRGPVSGAIERFSEPRGEFTLLIEGKETEPKPQVTETVERELHRMYLAGVTVKEAINLMAADTGLSRKELYQTWLRLDKIWERDRR
jgi:16S rRNA (cytidine1402-2'-O)-methyltransferase